MWAVVSSLAGLTATTLHAQPTIEHSGLNCMRPGEFVVVLSGINPDNMVETAKVYFRSSLYRDFYYVEMTPRDGRFYGVLPQPSEDTPAVIYYVEALDSTFNTARSVEYDADVRDGCRQESALAYLPGADSGVVVGATTLGASPIPPGFAAAGIVGTITAAGVASGVGGGLGAGTAVAVGAAAAAGAGAGVAVLGSGSDPTTTSSAIAVIPTSTIGTTSITAGSTSPTTTPNPGPSTSSPTTSTSTGPVTTVPGGSTTTVLVTTTPPTTTTPATTTAPPTTTVPPLDGSCFTVSSPGRCRARVDATCAELPVDRYEWVLDLTSRWTKVDFPNGPSALNYTWVGDDCGDDGETLRFRLKVHRGADNSTHIKNLFIAGSNDLTAPPESSVFVGVRTYLELPRTASGRILLNGVPLRVVDSTAPTEIRARAIRGENTLVAELASAASEPGTWRFAFDPIVPGSVRVVSGNVLAHDPTGIVFRVSGQPGERLELTFVARE